MLRSLVGTPAKETIVSSEKGSQREEPGGAEDWGCSDWGGEEGDDDGGEEGDVPHGGGRV